MFLQVLYVQVFAPLDSPLKLVDLVCAEVTHPLTPSRGSGGGIIRGAGAPLAPHPLF